MRIALGTAQFGLPYGISNHDGDVPPEEIQQILGLAKQHGIDTLDTAAAYGESESRLGQANVNGWHIISKLPPSKPDDYIADSWVSKSVHNSLERLGQSRLYALLLHRPQQLLEADGNIIYRSMQKLKEEGLVERIGISIYEPNELEALCIRFDLDLVQAPFNVFDRRLISSGWMDRLADKNIELHTRSVFLQGLLLMDPSTRPTKFQRWNKLFSTWDAWLIETGMTATEACIRYALSHEKIARVIVGIQTTSQLAEILAVSSNESLNVPLELNCITPDLLNPARWAQLG